MTCRIARTPKSGSPPSIAPHRNHLFAPWFVFKRREWMTEYFWFFVVVGGPVILGIIIAYGMARRRRLTAAEKTARDRQTRAGYHDRSDM
jgi:hypothetical protein